MGSIAYDNIKTPLDSVQWALGGSASYAALAASFFAPTMLCGIVGKDFKKSDLARLSRRGIDTSNVEIDPNGETFFWSGEYLDNFNSRETLETRVNVYENYVPKLNDAAKNADFVLLGNIGPDVQKCALDAMLSSPFVILDTMNLWIDIANHALKELIKRADIFIVNDSEAKLISGERNIILAGESLLKLGAKPHHIGIRSPVYFFPTPDAEMGIDVLQQTSRIQAGHAAPFYIGQAFFFQMLPDIIFRILVHRAAEMVFAGTGMGKVAGHLLRQAGMDVLHLRLFLVGQIGMFEKDHRVGQ